MRPFGLAARKVPRDQMNRAMDNIACAAYLAEFPPEILLEILPCGSRNWLLDDVKVDKLRTVINGYLSDKVWINARPRPSERRNNLAEAIKYLEGLAGVLLAMDMVTAYDLETNLLEIERLEDQLRRMAILGKEKLYRHLDVDRGGPKPDLALQAFIIALGQIYQDTTGRQPERTNPTNNTKTFSPFHRFVWSCLKAVGDNSRSHKALAQAIIKSLQPT